MELRRKAEPILGAKEGVQRDVDAERPRLSVAKKDGVYLKTEFRRQPLLLRRVPIPTWFDTDGIADEENIWSLIAAIREARAQNFLQKQSGGFGLLPPWLTLLPLFSLTQAFIQCDRKSIRGFGAGVCGPDVDPPKDFRTRWTTIFDFHSRWPVLHTCRRRRRGKKKKKKRGRKLLRSLWRLRQDISLCVANPWVVDNNLYDSRKSDACIAVPWFVSSLITDGLHVNVTLATISVPTPQHVLLLCDLKKPRPLGILELREKGYSSVDGTVSVQQHTSGLFSKVAPPAPAAPVPSN